MEHLNERKLGIQEMPEGYKVVLNDDETQYYWYHGESDRESCIHWDKWSVYRGDIADSKTYSKDKENNQ